MYFCKKKNRFLLGKNKTLVYVKTQYNKGTYLQPSASVNSFILSSVVYIMHTLKRVAHDKTLISLIKQPLCD